MWSAEWTDPRTACRSLTMCGRAAGHAACLGLVAVTMTVLLHSRRHHLPGRAVVGPLPRSRTVAAGDRADVGVVVAVQPGRDEVRRAPPAGVQPAADHYDADRRGPGAAHRQSRRLRG